MVNIYKTHGLQDGFHVTIYQISIGFAVPSKPASALQQMDVFDSDLGFR